MHLGLRGKPWSGRLSQPRTALGAPSFLSKMILIGETCLYCTVLQAFFTYMHCWNVRSLNCLEWDHKHTASTSTVIVTRSCIPIPIPNLTHVLSVCSRTSVLSPFLTAHFQSPTRTKRSILTFRGVAEKHLLNCLKFRNFSEFCTA